jgi:hypothetical protein
MSKVIFTHALADDLEAYCLRQALPKKLVLCVDKYIDTHFGAALSLELRKKILLRTKVSFQLASAASRLPWQTNSMENG